MSALVCYWEELIGEGVRRERWKETVGFVLLRGSSIFVVLDGWYVLFKIY
jgi:hypothetical protein